MVHCLLTLLCSCGLHWFQHTCISKQKENRVEKGDKTSLKCNMDESMNLLVFSVLGRASQKRQICKHKVSLLLFICAVFREVKF